MSGIDLATIRAKYPSALSWPESYSVATPENSSAASVFAVPMACSCLRRIDGLRGNTQAVQFAIARPNSAYAAGRERGLVDRFFDLKSAILEIA